MKTRFEQGRVVPAMPHLANKETKAIKGTSVRELGNMLFRLVHEDQNLGYVSDAIANIESRERLFAVVRGHLKHSRRAVRRMEAWLKEYDRDA